MLTQISRVHVRWRGLLKEEYMHLVTFEDINKTEEVNELEASQLKKSPVVQVLVRNESELPKKATKGSRGYDIVTNIDVAILSGEKLKIDTGMRVKFPSKRQYLVNKTSIVYIYGWHWCPSWTYR